MEELRIKQLIFQLNDDDFIMKSYCCDITFCVFVGERKPFPIAEPKGVLTVVFSLL